MTPGMNGFFRFLRRTIVAIARFPHPHPINLAPGALALAVWLGVQRIWPSADIGFALTCAFCSSLCALIWIRTRNAQLGDAISWLGALLPIAAVCVILLWQHDTLWTRRYLSIHLAIVGTITALSNLRGRESDNAWLWPTVDSARLRFSLSAARVLLVLVAIVLNESLIRFATISDWLVAWAIAPVVLHYAGVMTSQIVFLTEPEEEAS